MSRRLRLQRGSGGGTPPPPTPTIITAPGYFDDFNADVSLTTTTWRSTTPASTLLAGAGTILAADINGHASARLTAAVSNFYQSSTWAMAGATDVTVYGVISMLTANSGYLISSYDTGECFEIFQDAGNVGNPQYKRGSTTGTYGVSQAGAGYHIWCAQSSAGGVNNLFIDGVLRATFTDTSTHITGGFLTIGRHPAGFAPSDIKTPRVVLYNQFHDAPTLAALHTEIRGLYALS